MTPIDRSLPLAVPCATGPGRESASPGGTTTATTGPGSWTSRPPGARRPRCPLEKRKEGMLFIVRARIFLKPPAAKWHFFALHPLKEERFPLSRLIEYVHIRTSRSCEHIKIGHFWQKSGLVENFYLTVDGLLDLLHLLRRKLEDGGEHGHQPGLVLAPGQGQELEKRDRIE